MNENLRQDQKMYDWEFTTRAKINLQNFEMQSDDKKEHELFNKEILDLEDIIWHQTYRGFKFLSEFTLKNERLAAELRRYIFKNILTNNVGNACGSLTEKPILQKMAAELKNCFEARKVFKDIKKNGEEYQLPLNPQRLKNILLDGNLERRPLIRICFALGMTLKKMNEFLSNAAFMRNLSPAVPEELILIYCIENFLDWEDVLRLQKTADDYMRAHSNIKAAPDYTEETPFLAGVKEATFVENILYPCCLRACAKKNFEHRQYSKTALDFFIKNSILNEVLQNQTGQFLLANYSTVYISDIICHYAAQFPLKDYDFPAVKNNMVLSQGLYWRFLNYRIARKNPAMTVFSMKYGSLPQEISDNVLSYSEIINAASLYPHRINRSDILIISFYHFLMNHWKENNFSFVAKDPKESSNLWLKFFRSANETLQNLSYEKISVKNSFDAFLRIALKSISPLECFGRIYELNVIESFSLDNDSAKNNYPEPQRIKNTLAKLIAAYEKLDKFELVTAEELNSVKDFVTRAESKL